MGPISISFGNAADHYAPVRISSCAFPKRTGQQLVICVRICSKIASANVAAGRDAETSVYYIILAGRKHTVARDRGSALGVAIPTIIASVAEAAQFAPHDPGM